MKKTHYFLGGLPRSGSTLLCNVLAQNPNIYATHTSGCMDVLFGIRNRWNDLIEHKAHPEPEKLQRVLKGVLDSYYEDIDKPIIIDKCRGWISLVEMVQGFMDNDDIKIIVPVRDIRGILSSFEKLWRKNAKFGQVPGESKNYFDFQTVEGRCNFWMRKDQVVGLAYSRLKDAIHRGHSDKMFLVDFDVFTVCPENTMDNIYDFLGEPRYKHDFNNIEQVTFENDLVHGYKDLHKIRPKIKYNIPDWQETIGDIGNKYEKLNFWG